MRENDKENVENKKKVEDEKSFIKKSFVYKTIRTSPPNDKFFERLPTSCYNKLVMDEGFSGRDKTESLWPFLELKIQGKFCSVNTSNTEADFLGIGPHDRGNFCNGSLLWEELNSKNLLKTHSEGKLVCKKCGGQLIDRRSAEEESLDDPINSGETEGATFADMLDDSNSKKKNRFVDRWIWKHRDNCEWRSRHMGNDDFYLVRYKGRLYFPSAFEKSPYQKIECAVCPDCSKKFRDLLGESREDRCFSPVNKEQNNKEQNSEEQNNKEQNSEEQKIKCVFCGGTLKSQISRLYVPLCSYIPRDVPRQDEPKNDENENQGDFNFQDVPCRAEEINDEDEEDRRNVDSFPNFFMELICEFTPRGGMGDALRKIYEEIERIRAGEKEAPNGEQVDVSFWGTFERVCRSLDPEVKDANRRDVKKVLMVWEFNSIWRVNGNNGSMRELEKLFDAYWDGDSILRNQWRQERLKIRTLEFVKNMFKNERRNNPADEQN